MHVLGASLAGTRRKKFTCWAGTRPWRFLKWRSRGRKAGSRRRNKQPDITRYCPGYYVDGLSKKGMLAFTWRWENTRLLIHPRSLSAGKTERFLLECNFRKFLGTFINSPVKFRPPCWMVKAAIILCRCTPRAAAVRTKIFPFEIGNIKLGILLAPLSWTNVDFVSFVFAIVQCFERVSVFLGARECSRWKEELRGWILMENSLERNLANYSSLKRSGKWREAGDIILRYYYWADSLLSLDFFEWLLVDLNHFTGLWVSLGVFQ